MGYRECRYFDESNMELWVVDRPALAGIIGYIDDPNLGEQLRTKTIVVPVSVYNEFIRDAGIVVGEKAEYIRYTAGIANTLTKILGKATCSKKNLEFLSCKYLPKNKECQYEIGFVFITDASSSRMHGAIEYCKKNSEMIVRNIHQKEADLIGYVPEARNVYLMDKTPNGRYIFDFG